MNGFDLQNIRHKVAGTGESGDYHGEVPAHEKSKYKTGVNKGAGTGEAGDYHGEVPASVGSKQKGQLPPLF